MPSSSASSRISAVSGVSPGLTLPPGNSHSPAIDLPAGRWASNTLPSASTSATAETSTTGGSAAVAGIDIDVAVGQIAGPHGYPASADPDIDGDGDLAALHIFGDRSLVIPGYSAAPRGDLDPADRNRQPVRIDPLPCPPYSHHDAAPIRVAGGERRLDQRRVADRQPDPTRRLRRGGAGHRDRDKFPRTLAVAHDLLR